MRYQTNIKIRCYVPQALTVTTFLFLFINLSLSAQPNNHYSFRHITQENGLLHNDVYDIAQDKRGFIWIATANGLQRYDGTRFLNFHDMLNDPSQSSTGVTTLYTDNTANELWIRKSANTETLNLINNRITFYKTEDILQQDASHFQQYTDKNKLTYLLSQKAIFQFDSVSRKFHLYSFTEKPFSRGACGDFVTDNATGETWMNSNTSGLTLLDAVTKEVYTTAYNPVHNPVLQACEQQFGNTHLTIRKLMLDSRNNLWIATWGKQFYQYNVAAGKLYSYSPSSIVQNGKRFITGNAVVAVSSFFEDNHHTIWISTENAGLLRYNEPANNFEPVVMNGGDITGDSYNYNIFCIFQDREENIWLGTDKGITFFNPYRQYSQSIHHEENNAASLPKNEIECYIQTASGNILAGTWGGGITVFDSNWNFKKNIRFPSSPFELNLVWSFVQNDDGAIWAGCQHGYIHIYNPADESVHTIHPPELGNYTIRAMAKDSIGNIWFGLHNGRIAEWNKEQNKFLAYTEQDENKTSSNAAVLYIFFDSHQRCWVATEKGLKEFDTEKRVYSAQYVPDKYNAHSISSNTIQGIEQYNDSTLLIGTMYGGINLFHIHSNTFSRLYFDDTLPSQNIYAIKKDGNGNFWFTSDYSLYQYKPAEKKNILFQMEPGLINSTFKSSSFYVLRNGSWLTSTSTEIISFRPDKMVNEQRDTTPVEITGFKVFDKTIPVDSLLQNDQPVHLTYRQNFITVDFAKLIFSSLHQSNYYYRLQGVNDTWVNAGVKPFAAYTNLQPGNYTFEVKSDDNNKEAPVTAFAIIISPPFWKTWWFLLLATAGIAFMLYKLLQWRFKNIRAVEREKLKVQEAKMEMLSMKEKLSSARLEALRSQMNPHFIFNCLTSIDNLIQTGEKEKATLYLAKFAKLIRAILETSKSNTIPCWKDMEMLSLYLEMEELRSDKKFTYQITIADEIISGDYKVPPLVVQPFVENAIHHGLLNKQEKNKQLIIEVSASHHHIHYLITDNGVGRAKAKAYQQLNKPSHQSMGMQITIDRIHLFNRNGNEAVTFTDLYNTDGEAAGTKVEVNLLNQP